MARIRLLRVQEIAHITSTGKPPVNLPGTLYLLLLLHRSTIKSPRETVALYVFHAIDKFENCSELIYIR